MNKSINQSIGDFLRWPKYCYCRVHCTDGQLMSSI